MWSNGNLERKFEIELFDICYCPSGFRACGSKQLDGTPILPNHPCYQLHHTRILNFLVLLTVGIYVVKGEFEAGIYAGRFQNTLLSQRLPGLHLEAVGCRTHPPKCGAVPTPLYPGVLLIARKGRSPSLYFVRWLWSYYKINFRLLQDFLGCGMLKNKKGHEKT